MLSVLAQESAERYELVKEELQTAWLSRMETLIELIGGRVVLLWVGAKARGRKETEQFHYVRVEHTKLPNVRNFDALIEGGIISVDYLMSQKGPNRVRDHGYLFKISPSDFSALFPPSDIHVFA